MKKNKLSGLVFSLLAFGLVSCSTGSVKTNGYTPANVVTKSCQTPKYETLKLKWSLGTTVYRGVMKLNGCKGDLVISFWDNSIGKTAIVQQSLRISDSSQGMMLYGYNPVLFGTSIRYPSYAPDNFLFKQQTNGTWVRYTCDDSKQCSPVQLLGS